ncbi:radical SAM protein [Candidatus Bipolaricaulota bacterium]|nr:radical SAM protein [Candidatus Bipolaricaulota bacterium]
MKPSYISLSDAEAENRVDGLKEQLTSCRLCPLECAVDRTRGEEGSCDAGEKPKVSSVTPHFGEERPLVGSHGSGTIFLASCNLSCVYCQNHEISQLGRGREISVNELAGKMLGLQRRGCHNINWVSPTHYVPQLAEALFLARSEGLEIPLVYNTGGYDSRDTLRYLDGIVDIYMPDMKYSSEEQGLMYSRVPDYPEVNRRDLMEMHRQVGDLKVDGSGIAVKGLLIRHLVLPNGLSGTEGVLRFIAEEVSKNSYVNVMDQYRPYWRASEYEGLNRPINSREFEDALNITRDLGLTRGL